MPSGTHEYIQDSEKYDSRYINGDIISRSDVKYLCSIVDLLGDGVWEGIRLHNGQLVFLQSIWKDYMLAQMQ